MEEVYMMQHKHRVDSWTDGLGKPIWHQRGKKGARHSHRPDMAWVSPGSSAVQAGRPLQRMAKKSLKA